LEFHGPSAFAEILHLATEYASSEPCDAENQKYFILLIITDGAISDLESTKDEIVIASDLPISIIIVGIGENDQEFENMEA
jgi:hypothetical protein